MKPSPQQQPLSSDTIQRLLNDPDLSPILNEMIAKAGVYTSLGYQQVLHQFLSSDAAKTKLHQWHEEENKQREQQQQQVKDKEAIRRPSLGLGIKRLTKSKSISFLFELLHDNTTSDDHAEPPSSSSASAASDSKSPKISTKYEQITSNESTASLSSTSTLNTSKRTSTASFMDSLSSLNLNFNLAEETNPKNNEGTATNSSRVRQRRRGSLNCPLRASRNHAEGASRIQYLEKMV